MPNPKKLDYEVKVHEGNLPSITRNREKSEMSILNNLKKSQYVCFKVKDESSVKTLRSRIYAWGRKQGKKVSLRHNQENSEICVGLR